jgi:tetratricopeptide (TPR) repeat protein
MLSAEQIAVRLEDRLRLLTGGNRTALPRHQTMRAALDWSYALLSSEERMLLRWLSVFAGGFTLEAAETVCGDDALDLLASLVDQSLVVVEEEDGAARYRLLETVRQYAGELLDAAGEAEGARDRHLAWCVELAHAAEGAFRGPDEPSWLARLERDHDNLRAALRWALLRGAGEAALQLAAALARFWEMRGYLEEGRQWLMQALAAVDAPPELRARGLEGAGALAYMQGDYTGARALFAQSLALQRDATDRRGIASTWGNLGRAALRQGDYATARDSLEASLAFNAEIGHKPGMADAEFTLGVIALRQGDYPAASARFETSLSLNRELGNAEGIANALEELATVLGEQGDDGRQAALLEESLALYRALGDRSGIATIYGHLGTSAWARGEHDRARRLLEDSLALYRAVGDRRGVARMLANQALVALYQRDNARAAALCQESVALYWEVGDGWAIGKYLPILASAAFRLGQLDRAARLFGAATALRERHGASLPPVARPGHDRAVAAVRAALGEAAFREAWEEGEAMSPETAVGYALEGVPG